MTAPLPAQGPQLRTLAECEAVIERGFRSFVDVGSALLAVRDQHLYREAGYGTFAAYAAERWGLKRQRAYELMGAAAVVDALSEFSDSAPPNEAQAAVLARLRDEPEKMAEAWRDAEVERAEGRRVTADRLAEIVRQVEADRPADDPLERERRRLSAQLSTWVLGVHRLGDAREVARLLAPWSPGDVEAARMAHRWLGEFLDEAR